MNRCLETLHALRSHKCPSIVINMEQRNLYSVGAATPLFDLEFNLGKTAENLHFYFNGPESAKTPHFSTARKCENRHSNYS